MLVQARNSLNAGSISEVNIRLNTLINEKNELKKQVESLSMKLAHSEAQAINAEFNKVGDIEVLVKYMKDSGRNAIVSLLDQLKVSHKDSVMVIIGDDHATLPVVCSVNGLAQSKYRAGDIVRAVAGVLNGSGGGRPDFASGAGKDASKVNEALENARGLIK